MDIDKVIEEEMEKAERYYIEAIKLYLFRHISKNDEKVKNYKERGEKHEQIAAWLEELKDYKLKEFQCHLAQQEGIGIGYINGVDDLLRKIESKYYEECVDIDLSDIDAIAQQLKVGVENDKQ